MQQVIYVVALIKRLVLDKGGKAYQLARQIFLRHDASVKLHVSAGGHAGGERGDVSHAAGLLEGVVETQLVDDGNQVNGALRGAECLYSLVDAAVHGLIEAVGLEDVADDGVGIFLKHQCADDGFLHLDVARHHTPRHIRDSLLYGRLLLAAWTGCIVVIIHICD